MNRLWTILLLLAPAALPAAVLDGATTTAANAPEFRRRFGIPSTNDTAALTNFVLAASNDVRLVAGLAATNHALEIGAACSNLAWTLGADGTNFTLAASNSLWSLLIGAGDAGGTNARQFGALNLTNWSAIPTGAMANVPAVDWLTNATAALTNHGSAVLQSATNYAMAATNSASVTNWVNFRQPASAALTNASGNPNLTTNILGAGTVTVTSNNQGGWTITGAGGGGLTTNANQFGASVELTIKAFPLLTNILTRTDDTNHTNFVVEQSIGQFAPLWAARGTNGTLLKYIDAGGYNIWTNLPKPNYPVPTNNISIGAGKFAWLAPAWTDPESNSVPVQAFTHRAYAIRPLTSTRLTTLGCAVVTNGGCTVSHPGATEFIPDMFQVASGAASNNSASARSERAIAYSGTRRGANGWKFAAEWAVTNGIIHYGGGGVGIFIGLSDSASGSHTNMSATTNVASTRYAGFAVHGQLGAGATNWHFITKDNAGGNETRLDTTLPLLASNVYRGWVHCPPQGRTLAVRLDNLTANTTTSFYATATVPTNQMAMLGSISNRTNIIHGLWMSQLYLEAPTMP